MRPSPGPADGAGPPSPAPPASAPPDRVNIIGVGVHPMRFADAIDLLAGWVERRRPRYALFPGSDSLADARRNPARRAILNAADLTATDGMTLVRICRRSGAPAAERVYGPDVMLALCERSQGHGWRHYFYGGAPGVAEELARRLRARFPGLAVVGTESPPFGPLSAHELAEARRRIEASGADIVWVGLGSPKQEFWIAANRPLLSAPLMLGVGAAFDFHAGVKRQAPRWLRQAGGEWLFRLCLEPRRLGRRYGTELVRFLALLALQRTGLRVFPLGPAAGSTVPTALHPDLSRQP